MRNWGTILDGVSKIAAQPEILAIKDQHGKNLLNQPLPPDYEGYPNIFTNRGRMQLLMYEYAVSLGVEFTFGARISEFFEDGKSAGIVLERQKHVADLVIGADGVHSKARAFVTQKQEKAQKSGFAVYRSWFSLDRLLGNPQTEWIAKSDKDLMMIWIGENTHAIITTNAKMGSTTCFATHEVCLKNLPEFAASRKALVDQERRIPLMAKSHGIFLVKSRTCLTRWTGGIRYFWK